MRKLIFVVLLLCVFGCSHFDNPSGKVFQFDMFGYDFRCEYIDIEKAIENSHPKIGPDIDSEAIDWSKIRVYHLSKPYVMSQLKYPYDATFPPFKDITVYRNDIYYHVEAYALATPFGGDDKKRVYYEFIVMLFPDGGWRLVSLKMKYEPETDPTLNGIHH